MMARNRTDDFIGMTIGRWTVISYLGNTQGPGAKYLCACSCGKTGYVRAIRLRSGGAQSCGCLAVENAADATRTHGEGGKHPTAEYRSYWSAKTRCTNSKCKEFKYYGGRGIKMCAEWLDSYDAFRAYVGKKPAPGLTLDRIDVNGHYEPGNVRWATRAEQVANRRPFRHRNQWSAP